MVVRQPTRKWFCLISCLQFMYANQISYWLGVTGEFVLIADNTFISILLILLKDAFFHVCSGWCCIRWGWPICNCRLWQNQFFTAVLFKWWYLYHWRHADSGVVHQKHFRNCFFVNEFILVMLIVLLTLFEICWSVKRTFMKCITKYNFTV